MAAAAMSNLKKVSLELGGKSANIIFKDADINKAVFWSAVAIFRNMGQVYVCAMLGHPLCSPNSNNSNRCTAGSRLFVHESIYDEFMTKFQAAASTYKVGDPFLKETQMGPLVDEVSYYICKLLLILLYNRDEVSLLCF